MTDDPMEGGEVLVKDGRIAGVGTNISDGLPDEPVTDLGHSAILPGFVNLHTHLDYTVVRGLVDDKPFFPWIRRLTEIGILLDYDDFLASARLGALQLVRSGVTTVADSSFSGAAVEAITEAGLSGAVFQETFGSDPSKDYSDQVDQLSDRIRELQSKTGDRLKVGVSPHSVYTASERLLRKIVDIASDMELPIAMHVAETVDESEFVELGEGPIAEFYRSLGYDIQLRHKTPVAYLHDLGILGKKTIAAHCVNLSEADIALLAEHETRIAHCPKSNAKLAVGVCPLDRIVSNGIVTGIGTDSAVSCNSMDMFEEMRFGVLRQRNATGKVDAMNAARILELATLGGATALGLDAEIGTIETGKRADMVVVDLSSPAAFPSPDPYSAIVYSCSASDVLLTIIDGHEVYNRGNYSRVDASEVYRAASIAAAKLP